MGKNRPKSRGRPKSGTTTLSKPNSKAPKPTLDSALALLAEATTYLQTGQPQLALLPAENAFNILSQPQLRASPLPALQLLGEIHLELGAPDEARDAFLQAAALDPRGDVPEAAGGGADKFLWLAQLCEEGGTESVGWFELGIEVLRRDIGGLERRRDGIGAGRGKQAQKEELEMELEIKRRQLAGALCGAAEVYMTDLSWEPEAETRCESLVTEACLVAPSAPEPLQTLASVRISQTDLPAARAALERSLELWTNLPPADPAIPDFPTRISLTRLLMEADLLERALEVVERLVAEEDGSVEAWYLGGWCLYLMAEAEKEKRAETMDVEEREVSEMTRSLRSSRKWLRQSLKLYELIDYEDERLKEHAEELVLEMNNILGKDGQGEDDDEEDEWEDEDEEEPDLDEDECMKGT